MLSGFLFFLEDWVQAEQTQSSTSVSLQRLMCKKKNEANLVATSEGFTHLRYVAVWSDGIYWHKKKQKQNEIKY